jgi:PEP-CTERM motif
MQGLCVRGIVGAVVLGVIPFLTPSSCQADVIASTTFDNDLGGWTSNTPAQVTWSSTGGNPGGFANFLDATGAGTYIIAPSQYLGDYQTLGLNGTGTISFDHKIIAETGVIQYNPYEVFLAGPGGAATWEGSTPTGLTPWVTQTATLNTSDGWTVTSGSWSGLMNNVTSLEIQIELVKNQDNSVDQEGIDNVALTAVPEPGSVTLAAVGLSCIGFMAWRRRRTSRN